MITAKDAARMVQESNITVRETLSLIGPAVESAAKSGLTTLEFDDVRDVEAIGIPLDEDGTVVPASAHNKAVVQALKQLGYYAKFGQVGPVFIQHGQRWQRYGYIISW